VGCGTVVVFGLSWTASGTPPDSNAWLIQRGDHRTEATRPPLDQILNLGDYISTSHAAPLGKE